MVDENTKQFINRMTNLITEIHNSDKGTPLDMITMVEYHLAMRESRIEKNCISRIKGRIYQDMKYPHLRDDDNKLLSSTWYNELKDKKFDVYSMTAYDLLKVISEAKLSNSESVRRCRAKLQELHPELRGKIYYARHREKEGVKQDLKTFRI